MKLKFKQRMFSWFDSYDIYDENDNVVFTVKGQLAWGHCLKIFSNTGAELGTVKEKIITFLPKFIIYEGGREIGYISRKISFFTPVYDIDFKNWQVEGNIFQWDYRISSKGSTVAVISKQLFRFTDTYEIDVQNPADALYVVMFVVAMDAEKCSRK